MRVGKEVSPDNVGGLERGVTTQADVQRDFGEPTLRSVSSDGTATWRYSYEEVNVKDTGTLTRILCTVGVVVRVPACVFNPVSYRSGVTIRDELTIVFDEDLVVSSYTYVHEEIPVSGTYDPVVAEPSSRPNTPQAPPMRGGGPMTIPISDERRI